MKKEDLLDILKRFFGKEKDERLHAIVMLIIFAIFITGLVVFVRVTPVSEEAKNTTPPNNSPTPRPPNTGNNTAPNEFEINYSYVYTITYNDERKVITGKKVDDKEIFTIIDKDGSRDFAILSGNYLRRESGNYHLTEVPSKHLKYTKVDELLDLLGSSSDGKTYLIPVTRLIEFYSPDFKTKTILNDLNDSIILTVIDNTLRGMKIDFSNYLSLINEVKTTFIIEMEFSNVGTTEDFSITLSN